MRARAACLLAVLALPAAAQQPAAPRIPGIDAPAQQAPANPAMEAAEKAFNVFPEAARRQIQDDLIWASNFTATTSGAFGPRTYGAIQNFQRLARLPVNGILDEGQRRTLATVSGLARRAARLEMQADPRTGASVPIAGALFVKRETLPTGTRWESADGSVVLETGVGKGGAEEVPAAFDRFVALQAPGRRVTYKLLRPDFFVVSGEIGPRTFYVRYAVGPNNLRGYALSFPTSRTPQMERHLIAIANGFQAVPGQPAVAIAAVQPPAGGAAQPAQPAANPAVIPPGLILTGVVTAPNRIVTAPLAAACSDLSVNGKPARLVSPGGPAQPAVLEAETAPAQPLQAARPPDVADDLVILGFAPGARPALAVSTGARTSDPAAPAPRVATPLAREGGGALALDRRGQVVGLMLSPRQAPRLVAGFVPAASHALLPVAAAFPGLGASAGLRAEASAGAIAAMHMRALVPIACGHPVTLP